MSVRAGALVAVAVTALLAACGVDDAGTPRATETSLEVTVRLGRVAATRGMIELRLVPAAGAAVDIAALRVRDARFEEVPATPRSTTVDRPLNIPVDIGDALCERSSGDPHAVIDLAGERGTVVLPVDAAGDRALAQVHRTACNREAVQDAVHLEFAPRWQPLDRATARGAVTLERTASDEAITLAGVQGTVVFTLEPADPSHQDAVQLARLEPGDDRVEVPVEVTAARCDPHAFIESKRTYVFAAWVGLGDGDPLFVNFEPEGPARVALERLLRRGCGVE